ncbi:MAG TPA: host-nuclease inhibitor Gam family protein [Polymorphobacter sp.]|nr:host-nuclease inhibitor Gam family protein [Polymorphobacter sp.]
MTRRKADKLPAAKTTPEAITLLGRYAALQASIDARRAQAEVAIAETRAAVDAAIAPDEAALKAIFNQLKPWWSVAHDELTDGKRKSIELGGCLIGHRMTPPKVTFAKADEAVIIDWLSEHGFTDLVRTKSELDKPAIIKAVRLDVDHAKIAGTPEATRIASVIWNLNEVGVTITQKEEFFIAPIPPVEPATVVVEDALAEQVPA